MDHNSEDWFGPVESLPSGKHKPVNKLMLMQVWCQHQNTISLSDCTDLPAEPFLLGNKAEHWFIGSRQLPFASFSVHMAFVPAASSVNTCTGTLEMGFMILITLCPLSQGISKNHLQMYDL